MRGEGLCFFLSFQRESTKWAERRRCQLTNEVRQRHCHLSAFFATTFPSLIELQQQRKQRIRKKKTKCSQVDELPLHRTTMAGWERKRETGFDNAAHTTSALPTRWSQRGESCTDHGAWRLCVPLYGLNALQLCKHKPTKQQVVIRLLSKGATLLLAKSPHVTSPCTAIGGKPFPTVFSLSFFFFSFCFLCTLSTHYHPTHANTHTHTRLQKKRRAVLLYQLLLRKGKE